MSKRVHRFPLFSITASLHIKRPTALMLWRGLTQNDTLFSYGLLRYSPSLTPSLLLVVVSLSTFLVHSTLGVLLHKCC
ncbi:unnamed protein product [Hymenolepis diminuta]|uniref:Uncharacterized protein n=1 Tax=Hymenolepis diminuta TaxID=6216 RepID=A0A564XYZ1_HYMDI|nr:unnamed protein product [Hymenolepis diminuta]